MRKNILQDKHGDIPSLLFVIVSVFVAGIFIFIIGHLSFELYSGFDNYLGDKYNNSEAHELMQTTIDRETPRSLWDYVFLAIAMGYVLMMGILGFSTRVSPVFYFIYAFAAMFSFAVGVVLSNFWQTMVLNPDMAVTALRFPITNLILGNFFPLFITVTIFLTMILLFGKYFGGDSGGGLDG